MKLRDYQEKALSDLRKGATQGHKHQMLYMPTGSGKTVTAAHLIHSAVTLGHYALFIVDRVCLVEQAADTFRKLGLKVGIMQGENTDISRDWQVIVATIQTLRSRGAPSEVSLVMIDEGHLLHESHIKLMKRWSNLHFIGLSATPLRKDLGKYYTNLVRGPSVRELTDEGALVPVKAFCPRQEAMNSILQTVRVAAGDYVERDLSEKLNTKELVGDLVSTWQDKANNQLTLCFAVDIAHSKSIVEDFLCAGIPAEHMDGNTIYEDRKAIQARFKSGETLIISSVNVLGIGFDAPWTKVGIMARPTKSEALQMQYVGRLLRPFEDKEHALLLDHAGNTLRFGLPVDFEVPDLGDGKQDKSSSKKREFEMVECKECGYALPPATRLCPECGHERHVRTADVEVIDGELVEWGETSGSDVSYSPAAQQLWYQMLKYIQVERGYKYGWLHHKYTDKFGAYPAHGNIPPIPPDASVLRWVKSQQIRYAKSKKKLYGRMG